MEKVTIKTYAVKHKLSIFNVMKMVKGGKVKTEVIEENGKEVTYIVQDKTIEKETRDEIIPIEEMKDINLKGEIKSLSDEVKLLRAEIEVLQKKLS
jgi:hypothetical protein